MTTTQGELRTLADAELDLVTGGEIKGTVGTCTTQKPTASDGGGSLPQDPVITAIPILFGAAGAAGVLLGSVLPI
jgi:hypothetical protein